MENREKEREIEKKDEDVFVETNPSSASSRILFILFLQSFFSFQVHCSSCPTFSVLCDCHPKNCHLPFPSRLHFLLSTPLSSLFHSSLSLSSSFLFFLQNSRLRRKEEFLTEKRIQSQRKESCIIILLLLRHFFHQQL